MSSVPDRISHSSIAVQSLLALQNLLNSAIFEVVHETHCEASNFPVLAASSSSGAYVDIYGNSTWKIPTNTSSSAQNESTSFACPHCQRVVTVSKFAPHLEKCMGKNSRTSGRTQARRPVEPPPPIDDKKRKKSKGGNDDVIEASDGPSSGTFDENSLMADAAVLLDPEFINQLGMELGFVTSEDPFTSVPTEEAPVVNTESSRLRQLRASKLEAALSSFRSRHHSGNSKTDDQKFAGNLAAPLSTDNVYDVDGSAVRPALGDSSDESTDEDEPDDAANAEMNSKKRVKKEIDPDAEEKSDKKDNGAVIKKKRDNDVKVLPAPTSFAEFQSMLTAGANPAMVTHNRANSAFAFSVTQEHISLIFAKICGCQLPTGRLCSHTTKCVQHSLEARAQTENALRNGAMLVLIQKTNSAAPASRANGTK